MQVIDSTLYLGNVAVPATPRAMRNAVVREISSMSVATRVWYALLSAGLAIGAVSALLAIPPGWEVMGTSPSFEWGMLIVGYVFFAIMTSGLCLASSLGTVFGFERFLPFEKRHAILALLSLTTAFGIIALELHYPIRMVFGAVLVIAPSSPMWWMGVFYGAYLMVLIVEVWTLFTPHPTIHKYACTVAACIGVCAPTTLGAVFGVLAAKPFWYGIFTPILMVASAFVGGTALLGIVFWAVNRFKLAAWPISDVALASVRILLAGGLIVASALLARQVIDGLTSDLAGFRPATEALVAGPLAPAFWGARVLAGILVPLAILAVPRLRTPSFTGLASILALAGIFVDRTLFVIAGETVPRTTMAGTVGYPYAQYTPSLVEIGILIGAASFMAMAFSLCERYLPMGEGDVHAFWPWPWLKHHDDHDHDGAPDGALASAAAAPALVLGAEMVAARVEALVLPPPAPIAGVDAAADAFPDATAVPFERGEPADGPAAALEQVAEPGAAAVPLAEPGAVTEPVAEPEPEPEPAAVSEPEAEAEPEPETAREPATAPEPDEAAPGATDERDEAR
jgi:Ni/Fe-hydrogenase subunit HybB-like protein